MFVQFLEEGVILEYGHKLAEGKHQAHDLRGKIFDLPFLLRDGHRIGELFCQFKVAFAQIFEHLAVVLVNLVYFLAGSFLPLLTFLLSEFLDLGFLEKLERGVKW